MTRFGSGPEESGDGLDGRRLIDRRSFVLGGLGIGATIGLGGLAACTSKPSKSVSSVGQSIAPQRGGSLVVGAGEGVPGDYFIGNALGQQVSTYIQFAWPLFVQSPTEREPVNALAESYDVSADGLTHTFTIRSGLTFHDGSPLDADAAAKNFRAEVFADDPLRDKGGYYQNFALGIPPNVDSVDVIDEKTFRMVLTQPRLDLRRVLWYWYIMNPAVIARKNYGTDLGALRDAGSGPFRMTSFTPASVVEFERFEGFFGDVWLDRLRFQMITDDAALALALRGGEIDVAIQPSSTDTEALSADPAYVEYAAPTPGLNLFYELVPRLPELCTDIRIREAIWYSLNQEAYIKAFFAPGTASPSSQPVVVSGTSAYVPSLQDRPYDPQRAQQLLSAAGIQRLQLKAIGPPTIGAITNVKQLFEAMASDMAAAGIDLQITVTDAATAGAEQPNNDIIINAYDYEDNFLIFPLFFTGLGGIKPPDPRATNPKVAQLLDAASNTTDQQKQDSSFQQLMQLNNDELLMGIPLVEVHKSAIAQSAVKYYRTAYTQDPENEAWMAQS